MSRSITTTLSVKDNATPIIKELHNQMSIYQKGHAEAVKKLDAQNAKSLTSEQFLVSGIKKLQDEKKRDLQKIKDFTASNTKAKIKLAKEEIDRVKENGKINESLLGRDLQTTNAYYARKITEAEQYYEKIKRINRTSVAPLKRNVDLQQTSFDNTDIRRDTAERIASEKALAKEEYNRLYVNTRATNTYNDAVKKLNAQKKLGAIGQAQYNKALSIEKENHKKAELATRQHTKSTENLANQTIRYLRWAGTIAGVLYATKRAWDATLGIGIQVNKMVEDNTSGFAALISTNTEMVLSNGKVVNSYEKFVMGTKIAKETMEDIRKASVDTYATFPQLTSLVQQALGHTLGMGDKFGETTDQIIKNTIKFTQSMSLIGGSVGMEQQKIQEETRSMISGNTSTDSLLAVMLFGSPTAANEAIRAAKKRGANGVSDMLEGMMAAFEPLKDLNSYTKNLLDLQDAYSNMAKEVSEPIFEELKAGFSTMADYIKENEASIIKWSKTVGNGLSTMVSLIDDVALAYIAWKVIPKLISPSNLSIGQLRTVALSTSTSMGVLNATTMRATNTIVGLGVAAKRAGLAIKSMAMANAPLLALMAVYEGYNYLISDNIDLENELSGIMDNKIEDIEKLTKAQREYQSLILTKEIQQDREKKQGISADLKYEKYGLLGGSPAKNETTIRLASELSDIEIAIEKKKKLLKEYAQVEENSTSKVDSGQLIAKQKQEMEWVTKLTSENAKHLDKTVQLNNEILKTEETLVSIKEREVFLSKQLVGQKDKKTNNTKEEDIKREDIKKTQVLLNANAIHQENLQQGIKYRVEEISDIKTKALQKEMKENFTLQTLQLKLNGLKQLDATSEDLAIKLLKLKVEQTGILFESTQQAGFEKKQQLQAEIAFEQAKQNLAKETQKTQTAGTDYLKQLNETHSGLEDELNAQVLANTENLSIEKARALVNLEMLKASGQISAPEYESAVAKIDNIEIYREEIELLSKKRDIQEEYVSWTGDSSSSLLDSQIELIESTNTWNTGLNETLDLVGKLGQSFSKLAIDNLKADKAQAKLTKKYNKDKIDFPKDIAKIDKKYTKDKDKLNKISFNNELAGYGDLAGASKSFFDEKTGAYKILQGVEMAMSISRMAMMAMELPATLGLTAAKWGEAGANATASVTAAGSGEPYSAPMRVALMVGLMGAAMTMFGGSGGGGGGATVSIPSQADIAEQNIANIEADYTPILDKFDRQIELLESIDREGSAVAIGVQLAKATFESDLAIAKQEVYGGAVNVAKLDITGQSLYDWMKNSFETASIDLGYNIANETENSVLSIDWNSLLQGNRLIETLNAIPDAMSFIFQKDWKESGLDVGAFGIQQMNLAMNEFQNITSDYALDLVDSVNTMRDASDDFKDIFDSITGTTTYATKELNDAFAIVDNIGGTENLANYLKTNIDNIDELYAYLNSNNVIDTLLLQDPNAIQAQIDTLKDLEVITGKTFDGGVEDALNYLDAISLVGEAMVNSVENIQSFADSFLDEEEITQIMAQDLGVNVATTMDELAYLFEQLAISGSLLTDSELELLEANKALIESGLDEYIEDIASNISTLENVLGSLSGVIGKLKGAALGSSYSMDKYYASMSETLSLSGADNYEDFSDSLKDTIANSSALFDAKNFTTSNDQKFAQLVAAGQFEGMETTALEQIDYLRLIEENTSDSNLLMIELLKSLGAKIDLVLFDKDKEEEEEKNDNLEQWVKTGGTSVWESSGGATFTKSIYTSDSIIDTIDGRSIVSTDAVAAVNASLDANDALSVYNAALDAGVSANSLDVLMGWNAGASNDWAVANNLPSFAVGTARVPYDMVANIHKNEMIVPETFSNDIRNGDITMGRNDEVVKAIKDLQDEVKSLRISNKQLQTQIVDNTKESRYA